MAIKKELIQFTLTNLTDCTFNIPLFQQNVASINASTKYTWNVTTADLSCGTGTIVINGNTVQLAFAANLAGLLSTLNALGFGFFCSETESGSTYIYTADDTNTYGGLDLCPTVGTTTTTTTTTAVPPPSTTTTTTTTTAAPTTSTTTTTTTVEPTTTTTTTTTTVEPPPTTSTTTTTTTVEPTTTTTTTTTTVEPPPSTTTTTTTTTVVSCTEYFNNLGEDAVGLNYTDCEGNVFTNQSLPANQSICVQDGTLNGGDSGLLVNLGSCTVVPPTSTTTTTTTTTPPPTSTTTTTTTTTALILAYSPTSALDACNSILVLTDVVFSGGSGLCDATSIQANEFALEVGGTTVWVSDGTNVRQAVIDDPNVSGIATFSAACVTCTSQTTTTTTTTSTTAAIVCEEYLNNTGNPITGVDYTTCAGTVLTNQTVDANQSICIQQGTMTGGGFLTLLGNC